MRPPGQAAARPCFHPSSPSVQGKVGLALTLDNRQRAQTCDDSCEPGALDDAANVGDVLVRLRHLLIDRGAACGANEDAPRLELGGDIAGPRRTKRGFARKQPPRAMAGARK